MFQQLARRGPLARTIRLGGAVEIPLSALLLGVFTAACLALAAALVGSLFLSSCGKEKSQSPQQVPQEQTAAVNVNYGISNPWDSLMPYYSVSGSNYARIIYDKLYDRLAYVHARSGLRDVWRDG